MNEISPIDFETMKKKKETLFILVDVRQPEEYQEFNIGGIHIPLSELPQRKNELCPYQNHKVIVLCRSGKRSEKATQYLTQNGFNAFNLIGGIIDWKQTFY